MKRYQVIYTENGQVRLQYWTDNKDLAVDLAEGLETSNGHVTVVDNTLVDIWE